MIIKNCEICREEFRSYDRKARFCGRSCFYSHLSRLHKGKSYHDKSPFVKGHSINLGRKFPPEFGQAISARKKGKPTLSGASHYNWKGGITSENEKIRKSTRYIEFRQSILRRDDYTCAWCGQHGGRLSVDHIKPFSLFPELRFDPSNARVLCWPCHLKTDTYAGRVRNYA